ncbi:hypothetical protein ACLKA6_018748 [Drosophila palustris]
MGGNNAKGGKNEDVVGKGVEEKNEADSESDSESVEAEDSRRRQRQRDINESSIYGRQWATFAIRPKTLRAHCLGLVLVPLLSLVLALVLVLVLVLYRIQLLNSEIPVLSLPQSTN